MSQRFVPGPTQVPRYLSDAAFAHRCTNLLRWMKQTQMVELPRERRLGANFLLETGAVVFGTFWERQQQLAYETIDMESMYCNAAQLYDLACCYLPPLGR